MNELMNELFNSECHFIRAIKSNDLKKANFFNAQ